MNASQTFVGGERPLISIVIAVFNGAQTLGRALHSVLSQDQAHLLELIVVDGGSTDGTVDIIREFEADIAYWVSEPDHGIYDAWNKALRVVRGQWICFIGADDELVPGAVKTYADVIARYPERKLQYISARVQVTSEGKDVRVIGKPWSWPLFQKYMTVAHVGSLHHVSLYETYGIYDTGYRICGDYELLLRPRENLRTLFIDRITAKMAAGGVSLKSIAATLNETRRAKVVTGGRSPFTSALERVWAEVKARARSLIY